jgi:hypothetical protein
MVWILLVVQGKPQDVCKEYVLDKLAVIEFIGSI